MMSAAKLSETAILADASCKSAVRWFSFSPELAHEFAATNVAAEEKAVRLLDILQQSDAVISFPDRALDVMDFEAAARKALPPCSLWLPGHRSG